MLYSPPCPRPTDRKTACHMPRESKQSKIARAREVARRMAELYPEADRLLHYSDAFTLLIAVILSAQTTDTAVNQVTPEVFKRWPDAASLAAAEPDDVAEVIRQLGLYRTKAKHCVLAAQMLMSDFAGKVPQTMRQLTRLPGVGRKTANIVLNQGFNIVEGIAVDTHVFRIAHRLNFVPDTADSADKTERELLRIIPKELWRDINYHWVQFGREFCSARVLRCEVCPLADLCPR